MKRYIYILLITVCIGYTSCDYLEPVNENIYTDEILMTHPEFVEGLLMRAYVNLPENYQFYDDVVTDDAVTNLKGSVYTRMAEGEWSSSFYPLSQWEIAFEQIFYINKFLDIYKSVTWATDPRFSQEENKRRNNLHLQRLTGEAHGLRAWYKILLLQYHAGKVADGRLLGFPLVHEVITVTNNWELERNTFTDCVNSIIADLDIAIANLPPEYVNGDDNIVNETLGAVFENRIDGNAARALKSRITVLAASPSFAESGVVNWEQAATVSGNLLRDLGSLSTTGKTFYLNPLHEENIWNTARRNIRTWEQNNFPPSLFGYGRTNPSQNLVDAFPMRNGYPINHDLSGYDLDNPYANRDLRLDDYIIYDGAVFKNEIINTYREAVDDGINELETSTRTGYYLKKFMNPGVSLKTGSEVSREHSYTLIRATEVLLNYAEAANEAWGPDGDPMGLGFTAREKISALRTRAGIIQPDSYLASITDKEGMRELIRNERRIELCFEGFRFTDIRRWGLTNQMIQPVLGIFISLDGTDKTYEFGEVESRRYAPYMIYPPIPYKETLKYDIVQNSGW